MQDRAVLDSGVIFALYFEEDASEQAIEAVDLLSPITLDLAVAEVGNAAWKRVAYLKKAQTLPGRRSPNAWNSSSHAQ